MFDYYALWLESNLRAQQALMENYRQSIVVGLNVADQILAGMSQMQATVPVTRRVSYHREGNVLILEHITPLFSLKPAETAKVYQIKRA